MLRLFAILAAVASGAWVSDAAPRLSEPAQAAIARVHEAYERVEKAQAAQPLPKDDAERLLRLGELDQAPRVVMLKFDLNAMPETEREAVIRAINDEVHAHDRANQAALKAMLPPEGWFTKSKYGERAEEAAFLIVQHATNDRPWMHEILKRMEPLVAKGEVPGEHYSKLYDRVALDDGKRQRYGTQLFCKGHRLVPDKLEDPEHVNARRKALGMVAEEAYVKQLTEEYGPCP